MFAITESDTPAWFAWGVLYQYIMPVSERMGLPGLPELNAELPYYYAAKAQMESVVGLTRYVAKERENRVARNDLSGLARED